MKQSPKILDIRLLITLATMLLTIGTAWGITKGKLSTVEKTRDKVEDLDKRQIKTETRTDYLEDSIMEQRTLIKEQRQDTKQILELLLQR